MNIVKTYIDVSPIEGVGLFAGEDIASGTLIWQYKEPFDFMIGVSDEKILTLNEVQKQHFDRYSFGDDKRIIYCGDDAKYANHSSDANTSSELFKQWANRDIKKGEEITVNYSEINTDWNKSEFKELKSNKC